MATIHSFIDIFETEFDVGEKKVALNKIVIPLIQRDYAQGRLDLEASRVRERFLTSLYDAVTGNSITLDFVYGDIDQNGVMIPLDGQQRLTTLFLLHWYVAKKENIPKEQYDFLKKFSYETRFSARDFCEELVNFNPSFTSLISKEIINQVWFPLDYKKDPTISSMLVMIDAIDESFKNTSGIWKRLVDNAITFYFLPIKDMGLTDELYIKMNSRGKPLTLFEHFKAEFERKMRKIDETLADRITSKIDFDWTNLLWRYRRRENLIDEEFLHYFKFICDMIGYQKKKVIYRDEFDLLKIYFSNEDALENILTLESYFDCWCNIDGYDSPALFLSSFMGYKHENGKIIVDSKIDIFEDCLSSYQIGGRKFTQKRTLLLYAITVYLRNQSRVTREEFIKRIRIINNLIQNSEDEISDRTKNNRIPSILAQIDSIILTGSFDDTIKNSFNENQLQEEKEKQEFLEKHPDLVEQVYLLEDHALLNGQISIVGLSNLSLTDRFYSLFTCNLDKIDCALMSTSNYSQQERNKWRYQVASTLLSAWHKLFHRSANAGFENTKNTLIKLLSSHESFTNQVLTEITNSFLRKCEEQHSYPWRYYYIKYDVFRPGSYGKLSNENALKNPYLFSVMQTELQVSQNTYMPFLKAVDEVHLSKDSLGQRLVYGDFYIVCCNDSYLKCNNDGEIIETIQIKQDENGIDEIDRILLLKKYIEGLK